ncbi:ClpP/crotonase-like domain containing protein [Nitzschia inconspicua]|uniref:ClpP/crotonase-like domain containing protein n=1 Tax=Nitzschia inconspicua TaxID=303405 RepID=A0A9K3KKN5_9STRA|nr:ClpP/crotonase-like domain containing protein [Nitzschia inconspicua]
MKHNKQESISKERGQISRVLVVFSALCVLTSFETEVFSMAFQHDLMVRQHTPTTALRSKFHDDLLQSPERKFHRRSGRGSSHCSLLSENRPLVDNWTSIMEWSSRAKVSTASVRSFLLGISVLLSTLTTTVLPSIDTTSSSAWALSPEQLLVDDVWREVSRQFVDPTFAGQGEEGWRKQRLQALQKVAELGPDEEQQVYNVIRGMLSTLKDPYTRFLTPEQFESLTTTYAASSSSSKQQSSSGIGVQLIGDNNGGMVVVANIVPNSPAERSGILPGDVIRSIDGVDMTGATAEVVAAKCRGDAGSSVELQIERSGDGNKSRTLVVNRAVLLSTPVVESTIVPRGSSRIGILKINSFTKETETKVQAQLKEFVEGTSPVSAVALDLRGNVGGYMPAGVDVAKLFLPPQARIVSEVDKTGRSTIYINDGVGSDTKLPLYVIVDEKTASASEILAAALQDNHRATVVGATRKTFGKGRIQNVQALSSGSGIAITKAKYMTPNGRDIQSVGIVPDVTAKVCGPNDSAITCLEGVL